MYIQVVLMLNLLICSDTEDCQLCLVFLRTFVKTTRKTWQEILLVGFGLKLCLGDILVRR